MKKRLAIAIVALIIVFGGSIGFHFLKTAMIAKALAAYQPPPATVAAAKAKQVQWRPYIQAVGTLEAINGVNVSNAIDGQVVAINFHSGDLVKKGQVLIQLDDSQNQALLAQYKAQEKLTYGKYKRALALRKKKLNSAQDLDTATANYEAAKAQVQGEKVQIAKKSVKAPFDGRVGIREVDLGQYLPTGSSIVNLVQLQPLFITFTLPQDDLPRLHDNQDVVLQLDAYPDRTFDGKVTAINPSINQQSRTIEVQATVPNEENLLRPGMFTTLKVLANQPEEEVVVPTTAISYSLYGDTLYVLEPADQGKSSQGKNTKSEAGAAGTSSAGAGTSRKVYIAKQVFVKPGTQRGKLVAVSGIKPGDLVVTAGQIKLHKGSRVVINNSIDLSKERTLTP